jgi:uncharacterized ferredoxin-like protein
MRATAMKTSTELEQNAVMQVVALMAAAVANQFHIDNRIMYSIGRASLDLKLLGENVHQALGVPLSVTGKNPFFDRKP